MHTKKLGILGSGSAGIQSVCYFLANLPKKWEISLIYNPAIPSLGIGESTNGTFVHTIEAGLDFNFVEDLPSLDGTTKFATRYENWRPNHIYGPLIQGNCAMHFDTFKLSAFAIPRLHKIWKDRFCEIQGNVTQINNQGDSVIVSVDGQDLEYDYIMDCRGTPKTFDDYWTPDDFAVNHGLIHNSPGDGTNWACTVHRATVDGWMFQVPLTTRISNGYLFNNTITDVDQARENFSKEINVPIDQLDNIEYKFRPYYAKQILENRVVKNGNNALFFEPIFANALWNYDMINKFFKDFLIGTFTEDDVNQKYIWHVAKLRDMIHFKYHGGSQYKTKFWDQLVKTSTQSLQNSPVFNEACYVMKKFNKINNMSFVNNNPELRDKFWWLYPPDGLNKVDQVFGYNYFKV